MGQRAATIDIMDSSGSLYPNIPVSEVRLVAGHKDHNYPDRPTCPRCAQERGVPPSAFDPTGPHWCMNCGKRWKPAS